MLLAVPLYEQLPPGHQPVHGVCARHMVLVVHFGSQDATKPFGVNGGLAVRLVVRVLVATPGASVVRWLEGDAYLPPGAFSAWESFRLALDGWGSNPVEGDPRGTILLRRHLHADLVGRDGLDLVVCVHDLEFRPVGCGDGDVDNVTPGRWWSARGALLRRHGGAGLCHHVAEDR
jgi:hypothetical protein